MITIILFEDEQAISSVFRVSFERMGYTVLQAATHKQATKISQQYQSPIDLLIADMMVRVSSCVRVAKAMTSSHPQMAVLFISGLPPGELAHRHLIDSEVLGFPHVEFLQTPFMPWLLEEHVRELIGTA
jgi:DNA-binding NtrC family response regulator